MIDERELREIVTTNLINYRKANNYTQAVLAEKINYSDKAISKWERGESLPDLYTLALLADLYGITIGDLTTKHEKPIKATKKNSNKIHTIITWLAFLLVWLVATISYLFPVIFTESNHLWLTFVYALPVSCIVLLVFSMLWGNSQRSFIWVTLLILSIILSICLSVSLLASITKIWLLFILFIPLELLNIFWFWLRRQRKKQ
jgi:transcriptional regulator with XRE-family HTH domain